MQRRLNKRVIYAYSGDLDAEVPDSEFLHQILPDRLPGLGTQAAHSLFRIVTGKRRKIHARDGSKQPCRLPLLFYRAPCDLILGAAFYCAGIHANVGDVIQIEWDTSVGK